MRRTVRASIAVFVLCLPGIGSHAQEIDPRHRSADTNNAVIQGRVTLPSGFALERYARITLRNTQSVLQTIYTNKSGEFHVRNLSEGVYYVQAETVDGTFEPVTRRVELGRGLLVDLNMQLKDLKSQHTANSESRVVSAAELRQRIPADAKKQYELGLKFVNKGSFIQAATHFEEALKIYPEYLAARNDLGAQFLKLKRLDEAEKHFQLVLENDPKNFNAKFNMGLVRIERREYQEAISYLNQAIVLDSTRAVARLWLGVARLELTDLQSAETELTRALVMGGSECVAAHYHLARVFLSRGEVADAARSVQIYLQEAPRGELAKEAKELARQLEKKSN